MSLDNLLNKIKLCDNWRTLYALSEDFSNHGILMKVTSSGKHTLCRIANGMPVYDNIIDDFIFIEHSGDEFDIIPQRSIDLISEFVNTNASNNKASYDTPNYLKSYGLYGQPINIVSESELTTNQFIHAIGHKLEE